MKEVTLIKKPVHAEGFCTVSFTDPLTGKIKEQVKGKNHVFQDPFQTSTIGALLSATSGVHLCLSDDDTPWDDSFPFVKPNILGWGLNGQGSDGVNRGSYRAGDSYNGTPTPNGRSWRFVYDFTATQALGDIKSVSITNQFAQVKTADNIPVRQILYAPEENLSYVYPATQGFDGQIGYRCANSVVTKYDPRLNTKDTVDISALITAQGEAAGIGNVAGQGLFFEQDTGEWLLYAHNATAANRRIYRFNSALTSIIQRYTNVTNLDWNMTSTGHPNVGAAYDNCLFYNTQTNYIGKFDIAQNTNVSNYFPVSNPPLSGGAMQNFYMGSSAVYADDRYVYYYRDGYDTSVHPVVDLDNECLVTWLGSGGSGNNAAGSHFRKGEFSQNNTLLVSTRYNNASLGASQFIYKTALTKYLVPSGLVRQPGQGIVVDYQLNVEYVV